MRIGINGMCGCVRQYGMEPTSGDVYIFVGRRRTTMKLLHYEKGGYVLYYKRLERGRFYNRIFFERKRRIPNDTMGWLRTFLRIFYLQFA